MITVKTPDGGSERITIVDVDVHIHERPKELAPYCDMPWRRSLEMMEEEPGRYNDIGKSMDSSTRCRMYACISLARSAPGESRARCRPRRPATGSWNVSMRARS
jgi:hypothetical protein